MGSSTVNDNPAGLLSRVRLRRMSCHRNWDMLLVALLRRRRDRGADRLDYSRRDDWCVTGNKGKWTKLRPRAMPGIRGEFPATLGWSRIPRLLKK
jgi:hypothetical protein